MDVIKNDIQLFYGLILLIYDRKRLYILNLLGHVRGYKWIVSSFLFDLEDGKAGERKRKAVGESSGLCCTVTAIFGQFLVSLSTLLSIYIYLFKISTHPKH